MYCTKAKQICHWITYFPLEGKDSLISFSAKMTIVKFQQNETMNEDKKKLLLQWEQETTSHCNATQWEFS